MHFSLQGILTSKGSSLIESLLIIVVLSTIVMLLGNLPNAMGLISKSKDLSLAREIATKQIEEKRATSYLNLVNGTTDITPDVDSRISSLSGGTGRVVVGDCSVSICTHGENIKQVSVTINWKDNSKDQVLTIETFIGEGGINQ